MAGHLTEAFIAKALRETRNTGSRKELPDPDHRGLWLRIGKTGSKTWSLRARDRAGKAHWYMLGYHPEMGLAAARAAANETLVAVRKGADPIAERRGRMLAPSLSHTDTLAAVLAIYDDQRGCDLKSWPHTRKRVNRVFAAVLPRSVQSLTAAELQSAADRFRAKHSAGVAVRALRPVLRWAAKRGYCPAELAAFEQPAPVRQRSRVLSRDELAALLPTLDSGPKAYGPCLRFILYTAVRLGEATTARWRDIDWQAGTWTILQEKTKNDMQRAVPLSRQALALLRRRIPATPQPEALIFANEAGGVLTNWHRSGQWFQTASGTAGWHRHDLRRTAATLLGNLGTDPHVIEAALGHVTLHSGLASIYNRSRYQPQVAAALQLLGDALDGIEQGGAAILPLAVSA